MAATIVTPNNLRSVLWAQDVTALVASVSQEPQRYGGNADIYQGVWIGTLDYPKVAIKFVRSTDREVEKIMRRYRREIRVWQEIDHPHILRFLGLYWIGTRPLPAMVSLWCEHGNIKSYLQSLDPGGDYIRIKYRLLDQIAQGLAHLHSRTPQIVHGDLKGDNILVSDDGIAKICDFGLSKIITITTDSATHARGTLRWMAPELLLDDVQLEVSAASDVWAYGCVIVEVLSGAHPWASITRDRGVLLALMRGETPPRPESATDSCWDLALQCFSFDPNRRPSARSIFLWEPPSTVRPVRFGFPLIPPLSPLRTPRQYPPRADDTQHEADLASRTELSPQLFSSSFHRQPSASCSYTRFDQFAIINDLNDFHGVTPYLPEVLVSHDVSHEDWLRTMQGLSHALFSYPGSPHTRRAQSYDLAKGLALLNIWNERFYIPRVAELVILKRVPPGHDSDTDDQSLPCGLFVRSLHGMSVGVAEARI